MPLRRQGLGYDHDRMAAALHSSAAASNSIGDPICGHSRRFLCAHTESKEGFASLTGGLRLGPRLRLSQARWSLATEGDLQEASLTIPALPISAQAFNCHNRVPLRQRLAGCLLASSFCQVQRMLDTVSSCGRLLEKGNFQRQPVSNNREGNSKVQNHWNTNLDLCSKL